MNLRFKADMTFAIDKGGSNRFVPDTQSYLHVWRSEINFTEFENEKVMPVRRHRDIVAKGGGMITFRLIQDLILLRHARYDQLLAEVRGRANLIRVLGITNP